MDLMGAKHPNPPLGLLTVAALLPPNWDIRLIDCNVEELKDQDLAWAEIIMAGGNIAQQQRLRGLVDKFQALGKTVVVGGSDPTVNPHLYGKATHLLLGEGEITIPPFLSDLKRGISKRVYTANSQQADIRTSPIPRFDLIDFKNYFYMQVETSRGCPFHCEFCGVSTFYGHIPKRKETKQILREFETLYALGYRGLVNIADVNFIGKKREAKELLNHLHQWLREREFPFEFRADVSIDVVNDDELLGLMQKVGFTSVCVGVETPSREILASMKKHQNLQKPVVESIQKFFHYGIAVIASYIMGSDGENDDVVKTFTKYVEKTSVPFVSINFLRVMPQTQLAKRLQRDGRLIENYEVFESNNACFSISGLNFKTERPRNDIRRDFREVIDIIFHPQQYFRRVLGFLDLAKASQNHRKTRSGFQLQHIRALLLITIRLGLNLKYAKYFWWVILKCLFYKPTLMRQTLGMVAHYLHYIKYKGHVAAHLGSPEKMDKKQELRKACATGLLGLRVSISTEI